MDLQKLYEQVVAALATLGLTEIEVELKPKKLPTPTTKLFISCQTK